MGSQKAVPRSVEVLNDFGSGLLWAHTYLRVWKLKNLSRLDFLAKKGKKKKYQVNQEPWPRFQLGASIESAAYFCRTALVSGPPSKQAAPNKA
jgi:hypothetical protein